MTANPASPQGASISRRTMARGLVLDVGLPLVTYYVLHAAGVSNWFALLAATLVAGVRIVLVAVRQRVLNALGLVMLVIFGLGLVLAFATGDVRFLVLKDSIGTGVLGLLFLCFAFAGHPLTLAATRTWAPEGAASMAERYRTEPAVRHGHFVASMVWGVGLLAEALMRVVLVFLLPISVVVGLSTALVHATSPKNAGRAGAPSRSPKQLARRCHPHAVLRSPWVRQQDELVGTNPGACLSPGLRS